MNISGVIVHANPDKLDKVNKRLTEIPGVEVHGMSDEGRMVVTVETDGDGAMADTVAGLQSLEGVISAAMVYHHFDELENNNELSENELSEQEASQ